MRTQLSGYIQEDCLTQSRHRFKCLVRNWNENNMSYMGNDEYFFYIMCQAAWTLNNIGIIA